MRTKHMLMIALLLSGTACKTILVETTGPQGIQEDPGVRTAGAIVEDESIQTKVVVNMRSQQPEFRNANFNVVSYNGVVLLVGQVQTEALKQQATDIASQASREVRRIHNELEVSGRRSILSRSNDTWLATKVRTQMAASNDIDSSRIRVIANNGSIYLMGLVSEAHGDRAASLARNVPGVTRVVKVFEYI